MLLLTLLFTLTPAILAAPASLCPTSCSCTTSGIYLNARCNSLHFLKKTLQNDQIKLLVALDISNSSLTKVNANLNILTNLKYLNLSENKIQHIPASTLPKSLEVLDASYNYIKYLPHDIHQLPKLKKVDFSGNPIFCDCDSISIRDKLLNAGIMISNPVKCEYPPENTGKMWQNVGCKQKSVSLFDGMLGDAPYEGSGDPDNENVFINSTSKEITTESDNVEEGSGDDFLSSTPSSSEESTTADYSEESEEVKEPEILPIGKEGLGKSVVRACTFDCSTPAPIETNDTDAKAAPGIIEGITMLLEDLKIDQVKTTTTEAKEIVRNENITTMDAEIMDKGLNTDDKMSNINEGSDDKQSSTSFIFLAAFLLAVVCLVVYVVIKKRKSSRSIPAAPPNTAEKEDTLEEVELLTKAVGGIDKTNGTPEAVPLINGHKGNEDDGLKTTKTKDLEPKKEDDVQLRKPFTDGNALTPEAKRVTIKAGEIPNSTPKTPVLVVRHMNSDGNIITTPEADQRV